MTLSAQEAVTITNKGIQLTLAAGWNESLYAEWAPYEEASTYHVYVKGGQYADYTRIDRQLVRSYGTYNRADALGLRAASDYAIKVVPVVNGAEDEAKASTATGITVRNYHREGYAHDHAEAGIGAYHDDGTLKEGARILYIDDDDALRRLVARALARRGWAVTGAASGAEGVALAAEGGFDLVAVDHYMPGMDGLETLTAINALREPPPVVYVTGSDEGRIAVAALKAGAADYVVKAVGEDFFDLLAASFEQVLDRTRLERAKAAAEAELRASNARLEAMLSEVNHRVANSLQLVSAMIGLQKGVMTDERAREALEDTQRRIRAIAQVHRRLYTANDVEQVDLRDYLGALIEELGESWSSDAMPRTLTLMAEPIRVKTDRAVSIGVIVTELVTNACKYAYPDGAGEVRIRVAREDAQCLLVVEDDGCGMAADEAPKGTGLGTKLIRAMAQSLQTAVEYDPAHRGVRAMLRVPV